MVFVTCCVKHYKMSGADPGFPVGVDNPIGGDGDDVGAFRRKQKNWVLLRVVGGGGGSSPPGSSNDVSIA